MIPTLILTPARGVCAPIWPRRSRHPGYHTGHWEIGILVQEAAEEFRRLDVVPFAGMVSDPCDGRTQGTAGMMDSLPYRNDAAIVFPPIDPLAAAFGREVLGDRDLRQGPPRHDDGSWRESEKRHGRACWFPAA